MVRPSAMKSRKFPRLLSAVFYFDPPLPSFVKVWWSPTLIDRLPSQRWVQSYGFTSALLENDRRGLRTDDRVIKAECEASTCLLPNPDGKPNRHYRWHI
jgi:hypothetical protein